MLFGSFLYAAKADLIIVSYDRPLQLEALLHSIEKYVSNYGDIVIIYRSSSPEFNKAYKRCFSEYAVLPLVLKKQGLMGITPQQDFKYLVLSALKASHNDYVAFAADDIIIKDVVDLDDCIFYLKKTKAYGFYLRLGENINQRFLERTFYVLPRHELIDEKIMKWKFSDGVHEWNYPNSIDFVVYHKNDMLAGIETIPFIAPNSLEGLWARRAVHNGDIEKYGICYRQSKMVNIPYNSVQEEGVANYNMGTSFSKSDFLKLYNDGSRIDIDAYARVKNRCAHMVIPLHLRHSKVREKDEA